VVDAANAVVGIWAVAAEVAIADSITSSDEHRAVITDPGWKAGAETEVIPRGVLTALNAMSGG
jgi:hypothetical protein